MVQRIDDVLVDQQLRGHAVVGVVDRQRVGAIGHRATADRPVSRQGNVGEVFAPPQDRELVFAGGGTLEQAPRVRGVYFTSGTQEGSPIDRVMGALGRSFGLDARAAAAPGARGKSFFLNKLLKEVVFAERGLGTLNPQAERQRRTLRAGAMAAIGIAGVAVLVGWIWVIRENQSLTRAFGASLWLMAGGIVSLAVVITTHMSGGNDAQLLGAIGFAFGCAVVAGLANGILVGVLRLNAIVATIGMNALMYGAVFAVSGGVPRVTTPLMAQIAGGIPMSQNEVARASDLGIAAYAPGAEAQTLILGAGGRIGRREQRRRRAEALCAVRRAAQPATTTVHTMRGGAR